MATAGTRSCVMKSLVCGPVRVRAVDGPDADRSSVTRSGSWHVLLAPTGTSGSGPGDEGVAGGFDELAHYLLVSDRKVRTGFAELLLDLLARGRPAELIVLAATQKPAHDVIPTAFRDLFRIRWACAVMALSRLPTPSAARAGPQLDIRPARSTRGAPRRLPAA